MPARRAGRAPLAPDARGILTGLTRGTSGDIARACLEGIALQNVDLIKAMESDSGRGLGVLKVDGGASANDLLMQMQADMLGVSISRPEFVETTAQGAAFLAGLGAGLWKSKAEIAAVWREQRRFAPGPDRESAADALARWHGRRKPDARFGRMLRGGVVSDTNPCCRKAYLNAHRANAHARFDGTGLLASSPLGLRDPRIDSSPGSTTTCRKSPPPTHPPTGAEAVPAASWDATTAPGGADPTLPSLIYRCITR